MTAQDDRDRTNQNIPSAKYPPKHKKAVGSHQKCSKNSTKANKPTKLVQQKLKSKPEEDSNTQLFLTCN